MRQRVIIAMALALRPELVIIDEPTTALDVVVQREILQQVSDLQREFGFAVLFITHDLSLLLEFAHRIAIMYAGEIVEETSARKLHASPLHPYTNGLMKLVPAAARSVRADDGHPRRAARPCRPAGGLPLPSTLPALRADGRGALRHARRPSGRGCARPSPGISWPATSWRSKR